MEIVIPEEMRHFYFDFHWSNQKVWQLDAPVEELDVEELEWQLQYPIWSSRPPEPLFDLRPMAVIENGEVNPVHFQRILKADLSYPIDLIWNKNRWVILDGFHRLARAKFEARKIIRGRKHPESAVEKILRK